MRSEVTTLHLPSVESKQAPQTEPDGRVGDRAARRAPSGERRASVVQRAEEWARDLREERLRFARHDFMLLAHAIARYPTTTAVVNFFHAAERFDAYCQASKDLGGSGDIDQEVIKAHAAVCSALLDRIDPGKAAGLSLRFPVLDPLEQAFRKLGIHDADIAARIQEARTRETAMALDPQQRQAVFNSGLVYNIVDAAIAAVEHWNSQPDGAREIERLRDEIKAIQNWRTATFPGKFERLQEIVKSPSTGQELSTQLRQLSGEMHGDH